jgi:hypothetical protein
VGKFEGNSNGKLDGNEVDKEIGNELGNANGLLLGSVPLAGQEAHLKGKQPEPLREKRAARTLVATTGFALVVKMVAKRVPHQAYRSVRKMEV